MPSVAAPRFSVIYRGVVARFDDDAGLGVVDDDAGSSYPFHCTAIADGSRHIDEAVSVDFVLGFGRAGRIEARAITPLASAEKA